MNSHSTIHTAAKLISILEAHHPNLYLHLPAKDAHIFQQEKAKVSLHIGLEDGYPAWAAFFLHTNINFYFTLESNITSKTLCFHKHKIELIPPFQELYFCCARSETMRARMLFWFAWGGRKEGVDGFCYWEGLDALLEVLEGVCGAVASEGTACKTVSTPSVSQARKKRSYDEFVAGGED